jgi:hypothetical protein
VNERYTTWIDARTAALAKAHRLNLDVAIRRVKEYGRDGFNVTLACRMDSDYARAEIVKPTDQI